MSDDPERKIVWTDGHEQRVSIDNIYMDDPTGSRGQLITISLDDEDYEHQLTRGARARGGLAQGGGRGKGATMSHEIASIASAEPIAPGKTETITFGLDRAGPSSCSRPGTPARMRASRNCSGVLRRGGRSRWNQSE